jgi:hypothetical protein
LAHCRSALGKVMIGPWRMVGAIPADMLTIRNGRNTNCLSIDFYVRYLRK